MTEKTEKLLLELSDALFEKKAVLLMGNSGVGKTFPAKEMVKQLKKEKYNTGMWNEQQDVEVEILSCHNSVTYEDVVGGISASTDFGKMTFEYKDKILIETLQKAAEAYKKGKEKKYVLILDDVQRNDLSCLLGDAVEVIGSENNILQKGYWIKMQKNR